MAFTKVVGAGIHTLSNITSHNINSSGIITATKFVGPMENGSGISTFYDLRVTNNLTVDGTTTTLDTKLVEVDKIEVEADSTNVAIAVTQTGSGDLIRLYDGASQVVTVDDEGQVGIGTATPAQKLDVVGNMKISGNIDANGDLDVDGNTNLDNTIVAGIATFTNVVTKFGAANGGNTHLQILSSGSGEAGIFFDAANGDISGSDYCFIGQQDNLDFVIKANPNAGNIDFQRGTDTKVRIDTSGNLNVNYDLDVTGNAGIGSLSVTGISTFANVVISGVTTSTGNIYADNYFGNGGLTLNNNGNPSINLTSTSTTGSSRINFGDPDSSSVGKIYYVHDGDYFKFDTAYNERLRIDSSGRLLVGIHTSSTNYGWSSRARFATETAATDASSIHFGNSTNPGIIMLRRGGSTLWHHHAGRIYTDHRPAIHFETAYATAPGSHSFQHHMTMKFNAGVGIGTVDPKLNLHVHEKSSNASFAHFTNTTTGVDANQGLSVGLDSDENAVMYHYGSKNIRFATANTQHMVLTSTGQLGIGTAFNPVADAKRLTVICDQVGDGIHIGNKENLYPAGSTGYSDIRFSFYDYLTGGYTAGGEAIIRGRSHNSYTNSRTTQLLFMTASDDGDPSSGTATEKVRITHDGDVAITTRGSSNTEGVSKVNVEIPARTTTFSASDGDTWHDILIENPGAATNNAVGLAFQVTGDTYHKNAGTGIAAVKNGTNSDYGADLVFITRPQSAVAEERLRITSDGKIGINQSTPTAKLQVTGGGAYTVADSGRSVEGIDIQSSSGDVNGAFGGAISFGVGATGRAAIAAVQNNADDDNVGLAFFTHPSNTGTADAEEKLRLTSDGKLFSKSSSDATPNFKFRSDDVNWHGYLNQTVHGATISTILSCGGTWTVDGTTYAATKDYNGSFSTGALVIHNQYNSTASGGQLVFLSKANGSSTTDGAVTERLRIGSSGVLHINSVSGGQAVIAYGNPTGNTFQEQNRIGGDTIFVADESISSAIYMPRQGCFVIITAFSDTSGIYPQPNTSCMAYVDCGASRNIRICDLGTGVGTAVAAKNAYTSNVSDCDDNKLTIMAGDTQGTFRLVNRESNNDYYYQITFL